MTNQFLKCAFKKIIASAPKLALPLFLMTLFACGQPESTTHNLRYLKSLKSPFSLSTPPAWSPNGHEIAAGSLLNRRVLIWDINTGKILRTLDRETGSVNALAYSPNGKFLAVGRGFVGLGEAHLNLYDAITGRLLRSFIPPPSIRGSGTNVDALAFSPDSRRLAVNGYGSESIVVVYDVATGNVVAKLDSPARLTDIVYSIAYSPNGKYLAIGRLSGTLELKDTKTWSTFRTHHEPINLHALTFSPDSKYLAVGSWTTKGRSDNSSLLEGSDVRVLDCSTFKLVKHFMAYEKTAVASLRYTPEGKLLLIGGAPAKIIDANTGSIVREIKFSPTVHHPSSSPDGRLISVASRQKVQLWVVR